MRGHEDITCPVGGMPDRHCDAVGFFVRCPMQAVNRAGFQQPMNPGGIALNQLNQYSGSFQTVSSVRNE
jgi:hypothetical protein